MYSVDTRWPPIPKTKFLLWDIERTARRFEESYKNMRRYIVRHAILLKGVEGRHLPLGFKPVDRVTAVLGVIILCLDKIDWKIVYTQKLFDMVAEHDVNSFFKDLELGLDYVLQRWDKSKEDPAKHWYLKNPERVRRTALVRLMTPEEIARMRAGEEEEI